MSGYDFDGLPHPKRKGCKGLTAKQAATQLYLLRGNHDVFERCRTFVGQHVGSYYRHIVIRLKENVCIEDVVAIIGGDENGSIKPCGDDWADHIYDRS